MSFNSKLKGLLSKFKSLCFPEKEKSDLIQLWTAYRNTKHFEQLKTGVFPKPPENGFGGQEKGIYFWNQKGGPKAWLNGGVDALGCSYSHLMASTVLTQDQLVWPNWKVDAYIHTDLLVEFLVAQAPKLWERQGRDVTYPIQKDYWVTHYFKYGEDERNNHLVHSVSVTKDGISIYDETATYTPYENDPSSLRLTFTHKHIVEHKVTSSSFGMRVGTLEKAIDCLCQNDSAFRADYNVLLKKMSHEVGLKSVKYCAKETLPVAILRSVYGNHSAVQYTNPLYQDAKGAVFWEKVGDKFEERIERELPEAYTKGTGHSERKLSDSEWKRNMSFLMRKFSR